MKKLKRLEPQISNLFEKFRIIVTESKAEARQVVIEQMSNFDVFVACGGDGTIQFLASELIGTEKLLGVLPLGSGNDFAKVLTTNHTIHNYLQILLNGIPKSYDLIKVNESSFFINTFGIGFDGLANSIAGNNKWMPGRIKYAYSAIKSLMDVTPVNAIIKTESSTYEIDFSYMLVLSNGRWEGGSFLISPKSVPNDGILELTVSTSDSKLKLAKQLFRLLLGKHLEPHEVKLISLTSASISLNEAVVAHADGEIIKPANEFHFELIPNGVTLLA